MKRKFNFGKNQVVLGTLVLMIAVAGYLNYIDAGNNNNPIVLNDNGEVASLVGDNTTNLLSLPTFGKDGIVEIDTFGDQKILTQRTPITNEKTEPGEAIFVNARVSTPYFSQVKLTREQSRSKQRDMLTDMINNDKIGKEQRSDFANEMLKMQQRIEKETAAESMIAAKGFGEVYVRIDDTTVDVVVDKEKLTEQDIAQIQDIVTRKTGLDATKIRISPYSRNK